MAITIRRIRPDEGEAFRAIRIEAIQDSPSAFGSTLAETRARPHEYWDGRAQAGAKGIDSVIYVAEDDGQWVGIVGGFVEGSLVQLVSMWVNPAYRGRGIGRQLVGEILSWTEERGISNVELWVTEDNTPAIELYTRCGFVGTARTQPVPSHPHLNERRMVRVRAT